MGNIYASCGHQISWEWQDEEVGHWWEQPSREGDMELCYGILCPECVKSYPVIPDDKVDQATKDGLEAYCTDVYPDL